MHAHATNTQQLHVAAVSTVAVSDVCWALLLHDGLQVLQQAAVHAVVEAGILQGSWPCSRQQLLC
jgi:hypothetical protein